MQKTLKMLRWVFSIATVAIVLLLCWQCLDIYLMGNRPENLQAGVYLSPVYSVEVVSKRLAAVTPLLIVYAIIAAVTVFMQLSYGNPWRNTGKTSRYQPRQLNGKAVIIARLAVLSLGVLFIILGLINGGSRDVLVKAINICTECIGLG